MQLYQSGWLGSSQPLASVTRVSLPPQEDPKSWWKLCWQMPSFAMDWHFCRLRGCILFLLSAWQNSYNFGGFLWGAGVSVHTQPEKRNLGHCYSDSTVWIREIGPWGEKLSPCWVRSNGEGIQPKERGKAGNKSVISWCWIPAEKEEPRARKVEKLSSSYRLFWKQLHSLIHRNSENALPFPKLRWVKWYLMVFSIALNIRNIWM